MALVKGTLFFAPGIPMASLDFEDHEFLIEAFDKRMTALFIEPITFLRNTPTAEGGLFASALLIAALIEAIARIEGNRKEQRPISTWLLRNVPIFATPISVRNGKITAADVFEDHFRNGLAHNGYVAGLGRLSNEIEQPVRIDGAVVVVNPFQLLSSVQDHLMNFTNDLHAGKRDRRCFAHNMAEQFHREVEYARENH